MLRVKIETPYGDTLIGTVADGTDLDGTFTLMSDDDGERYNVNGWACYVDVLS